MLSHPATKLEARTLQIFATRGSDMNSGEETMEKEEGAVRSNLGDA
jgi:hypothetical protein